LRNKKKILPVSIVIPTLGRKHLNICIKKIFESDYLPKEVIIVMPSENHNKFGTIKNKFYNLNIKILISKKKNQVYQRIIGFKNAKFGYVLQLDDDVRLSKNCLFELYKFIKGKNNISVAPRYADKLNVSSIYKKPFNFYLKFYHWLLNSKSGYAPGKIALCGFNYSEENKIAGFRKHDWLSGGAVMHRKKNLILDNYYPYNFKRSLCEDVLHSLLLRKKKIVLIKYFYAKVYAEESSRINLEPSFILVLKNLLNEFRIRNYIVKKFKFSKIRMLIYYFIFVLRIIVNKYLKKSYLMIIK